MIEKGLLDITQWYPDPGFTATRNKPDNCRLLWEYINDRLDRDEDLDGVPEKNEYEFLITPKGVEWRAKVDERMKHEDKG
jgi:hypothetical protein